MKRREFLHTSLVVAAGAVVGKEWERSCSFGAEPARTPTAAPVQDRLCLFTDHLDDYGYSYADVAKMLSPLKIAGPDLTVRA